VALLVQVAAVLPVVEPFVAARLKAATCQLVPFQYSLSEPRCSVKVALFAFRPEPVELSATLPLKLAGTVAARKKVPFPGVVTEAVIGAVESLVTVVVVLPWLLTASVTQTRIVLLPSASEPAAITVATVLGCVL
jgi:hypothetical protein